MKLDEVKDLGYAVVIPLPTDAELSKDSAAILAASPPINVLRMFAGTGDMFPALLAMVKAVFYDKEIEPRLREVIVLRCAHLLDCPYEWQANMVMAPNAGVTAEEIAAVGADGPVESADPAVRRICKATDELTHDATLQDATLAELIAAHGPRLASKYILAIAWFNLLSRFLNATRVPLEATGKLAGRTSPI
jgi:alkylhydroperoxidase family enzyme